MPDIDAMELVEQFFALGSKVVGTANPVAIFLARCRECLPEWELQASRRRLTDDHSRDADTLASDTILCPRGAKLRSAVMLSRRSWVGEGPHGECEPVGLAP
jgi:hypothetical protein